MCNEIDHDHTLHESLHHNEHRRHPSPCRHPSLRSGNTDGPQPRHLRDARDLPGSNPRSYGTFGSPPLFAARFFTGLCGPKLRGWASQHALRVGPLRDRATPRTLGGHPGGTSSSQGVGRSQAIQCMSSQVSVNLDAVGWSAGLCGHVRGRSTSHDAVTHMGVGALALVVLASFTATINGVA